MNNIERHAELCKYLADIYAKKNHDYGDSFHKSYEDFGPIAAVVRMSDKMERIKTLINKSSKVSDESIRDTLLDLANYSIMLAMELEQPDDTAPSQPDPVEQKGISEDVYKQYILKDVVERHRQILSLMNGATIVSMTYEQFAGEYACIIKYILDNPKNIDSLCCRRAEIHRRKIVIDQDGVIHINDSQKIQRL